MSAGIKVDSTVPQDGARAEPVGPPPASVSARALPKASFTSSAYSTHTAIDLGLQDARLCRLHLPANLGGRESGTDHDQTPIRSSLIVVCPIFSTALSAERRQFFERVEDRHTQRFEVPGVSREDGEAMVTGRGCDQDIGEA